MVASVLPKYKQKLAHKTPTVRDGLLMTNCINLVNLSVKIRTSDEHTLVHFTIVYNKNMQTPQLTIRLHFP